MKKNRSKLALLISIGIHFILMLVLSPFIVQHFNETETDLSLLLFTSDTPELVKRRTMLEHKSVKPKLRTDSGSPKLTRAAPKYAPEMNPPKAPVYDNLAPEIVTFAEIPTNKTYSLPNSSFGNDADAAGPVVIPGMQGAGGKRSGPGRGGTGTGRGGGMGKRLASITNTDDLASIGEEVGKTDLSTFITDVMPGHGFVGKVYIPGKTIHRMPDFKRLKPVYTFATANLDVPTRDFTQGFPTPHKQNVFENFAIQFSAKLAVNSSGVYEFTLVSDDGSKLYINNNLVVNNDGVHGTRSRKGTKRLTAGFHDVEIHYFQGPRFSIALQWFYKPPNQARRIVPPQVIFHPNEPDIPDPLKGLKERLKKTSK